MKKIALCFYFGLPFFICSLFAVLVKYTTFKGGFIDFSSLSVLISYVFWGIILAVINLLLFKSKQVLTHTWSHQIAYLIAYILLCIVSNIFVKPGHSCNLIFVIPIIIFAFIIILNVILPITIKPQNKECTFGKTFLITFILLICVSLGSTYHYYNKWDYYTKRAQVDEIPPPENWWRDFETVDFEIKEKNIDRQYRIIRSKHSDVVEHISMTETFYFEDKQQGKKILKHLKKVYKNMKYYIHDLYQPNTYPENNPNYKYYHSICSDLSREYGGVGYYYELTEEFLNKTNPMIKNVTIDDKVSYSKLEKLLLENNYKMTVVTSL